MDQGLRGEDARALAEKLLRVYFQTNDYPFTRHHIESFDQFLSQDLAAIIAAQNPIVLLHDSRDVEEVSRSKYYEYKAEIFIGGLKGDRLYVGTPTISLQDSEEIRLMFPNEARLRNLTYAAQVEADIVVRITYTSPNSGGGGLIMREEILDPSDKARFGYLAKYPVFKMPIMLHSRYCILNGKPQAFLREAGECQYDNGGYFIVDGSERVLITHQQQAFNTLYISQQPRDPKVAMFSSITCLNPATRTIKRVAFTLNRLENTLHVTIPFVRRPLPIFLLFRALGVQSDEDILRLILPDPEDAETKILQPMLHESILEAYPFYDSFSAIQYIKVLTKGFSEAHVLDILYNQLFIHVENRPKARAVFLAECIRRILRVKAGIDTPTDRDDIRNQRCLTSGVLTRMMFQGVYDVWRKAVRLSLDREYNYNKGIYGTDKYPNLFLHGVMGQMLRGGRLDGEPREAGKARDLTLGIMRAFKGKWSSGSGVGVGEEKTGLIQALSRLSYLDFMSHCRRVVLDFDTGMKLPGPRRLHTSQYGYFCTSETPGGASIGIAKNLSILTAISVSTDPAPVIKWLLTRGDVTTCDQMTPTMMATSVPVFVNSGIIGYTLRPIALRDTLKVLKWTGCLPASASVGFSIRDRRVFVYLDEGRPLRPLIHLGKNGKVPIEALQRAKTWRDLVIGVYPQTIKRTIYQGGFLDPLAGEAAPTLEDYVDALSADCGVIEYVDPYEMNETFVANFPEYIRPDTSHMEIHPSTIVGLLTSMIPYANHNQSPRNQLGDSQSKQGIAVYATNFMNRFDNQAHVLCYPQAPLVRTLYYDYLADGQMGYGTNLILAMGSFTGYNQDDGIVMNADSFARGMFRSTCYRTYEAFEEDDPMTSTKTRIGNPGRIPGWTSLRPGIDYSKLDERGVIRVGEMVDETTVLVGMYMMSENGDMKDASKTAQVWTRGRVEKISVTVNNLGLVMVKVRVVQERVPELGDKFCLTADHEVLTKDGWVAITAVTPTMQVAQLNTDTGRTEFVYPTEVVSFEHTGEVYRFMDDQRNRIVVSPDHRMFVQNSEGDGEIILARDLYESDKDYYFVGETESKIGRRHKENNSTNGVYCLTVPSGVFLVRNMHENSKSIWTGNSNRHGQKGTIGMFIRGHDMPRTKEGIPVDMIMNPHAIPSRMTVAQLIEALIGKAAPPMGSVANGTLFMNDGSPVEAIGKVLRDDLGMEPFGEELMYDGMGGKMIPTKIFVGNVYTMRLKHMPEDKWNARGEGRREQRTHQPTGGRGAQGGLRIGEMERDAILGHGIADFLRESLMKRADGYQTVVCNGCGTIPIYNEGEKLYICPMCDGPVQYIGESANTLDILPATKRSVVSFSRVEIPYAFKLLDQELNAYLNMGMRVLTDKGVKHFRPSDGEALTADQERVLLDSALPERVLPETSIPAFIPAAEEPEVRPEDLEALGAAEEEAPAPVAPANQAAAVAAANQTQDQKDGVVMKVGNMNISLAPPSAPQAPQVQQGGGQISLEDDEADDIPFANPTAQPMQLQQPLQQPLQVAQVQSQPYMVVPFSVNQAPAPTEFIPPPAPGAPPTLAVDTSQNAMKSFGAPSRPTSPRRNGPQNSSGVVSVSKMGSSPAASQSANVRVSVNKIG
jgi:DNA-directed RNA polymerase II subunit RPB2